MYSWGQRAIVFEPESTRSDPLVRDAVFRVFTDSVFTAAAAEIQKEKPNGFKGKPVENTGQQVANFHQLVNWEAEVRVQDIGASEQ